MATVPASVSESTEVDTGRLEDASRSRVLLIVLAIVAATEIVPFHYSFISMSVRLIGPDFPSAGSQLAWLNTLYALVGGVAVPIAGKLSDMIGKKRVIFGCLLISLVGSVLDAMTHSWGVLLVGRALQGLAFPVLAISYGLVRDLVPRRMVAVAIAVAGGGTGVGAVLGPIAGGALTDHYSWRSLFWFCAIYSAVTTLLLLVVVPETRLRAKSRIDFVGTALLGAGIALVLIYLSRGSDWGWGGAGSLAWLIGGLALLALFYAWETRTADPIMSPKLLRSSRLATLLVWAFLINICTQGLSYLLGYLAEGPGGAQGDAIKQQVATGAAQQAAQQSGTPVAGLQQFFTVQGDLPGMNLTLYQFTVRVLLVMSVVYVVVAPITGWLSTRFGLRLPAAACAFSFGLGSLLLYFFHDSVWQLALCAVPLGIGAGIFLGTVPNMLIEAVPQEQQGASAGMYGVFSSFGSATATAVVAAVMAAHPLVLRVTVPGHESSAELRTGGLAQLSTETAYSYLFLIFAGVGLVGLSVVLLMRHYRHPTTGGLRS
ncbi:MFS transporter [Streptomyces sp. NRRL B-3229]|uniref:MFS transporter n=1 Tax=Streptomyces sp. NRRL B-3229 TaxID=1463836 RepID=UPI00131D2DEE|nr:MFS transporter [Streptomyces sp. NRRL B-3229]